jgi:glycosyltransferase involved in cell wall biosynthesis
MDGVKSIGNRNSLRVMLFNLATDADDPILGFTTRWIRALAAKVHSVQVITMRAGRVEVPENVQVHSVGKERGYTEPRRAVEFYRLLVNVLKSGSVDVCFAHMMPLFAIMAAPVLKIKGIPIVTWYAYPTGTVRLKVAERVSDQMVTGIYESYPYRSMKLRALGHGIDTELFSPDPAVLPTAPPTILCAGRLSPIKDHPTLLSALSLLRRDSGVPFRAVVLGGPAGPEDNAYISSLHESTRALGLEEMVSWRPPVPLAELPVWYRRSALHVNMSPIGSVDKVVLEAMACCTPSITANEGFRATGGAYFDRLYFTHGNAADLATKLGYWLTLPRTERANAGAYLREQVVRTHNLEALTSRLVNLFLELQGKRRSLRVSP